MVENVDAGRRETFPALTGIRFFAAAAVLLFHYGAGFAHRAHVPGPLARLLANGYLGVSVFFVLSGFILTYTYRERTVSAKFCADFAVARLARLYPVYLAALVLALPVVASPLSLQQIASVLLMVQAWTAPSSAHGFTWLMQAWTLSVEAFFYILFVAFLPLLKRLGGTSCGAGAAVLGSAIVVLASSSVSPGTMLWTRLPGWLPVLPALRFLEFAYGALLCRLMLAAPPPRPLLGGPATMACAAAILAILCTSQNGSVKAVATVLTGLLVIQLADGASLLARWLGSPAMLLLGGASYSLYLFQGPVHALCGRFMRHPLDQIVSPAATLALAISCFLWLEQPARRTVLTSYRKAIHAIPSH